MEKLLINIPESKSNIVKQILHGLGVDIQGVSTPVKIEYKQKLKNVSIWNDEDIKTIKNAGQAFNNLNAGEW